MTRTRSLVALLLLLLALVPHPAAAQQSLSFTNWVTAITVNDDASFTVRTEQSVWFDDVYETAFFDIPTDRAGAIRDVRVAELRGDNELPLDFSITAGDAVQAVDFSYSPSDWGETRTFVLEYTVVDGLWVYDDADVLRWFAVNADRSGLPVERAEVRVTLPPGAEGAIEASVPSGNGSAEVDGARIRFLAAGPLQDGEPFEIEARFPHGVVPARIAPWQRAAEEEALRVSLPAVATTVVIQPDGRLDVSEQIDVAVEEGVLYSAFREIRHSFVDGISAVRVAADGAPLAAGDEGCDRCFAVTETPATSEWTVYSPQSDQVFIDEGALGRTAIDWWVEGVEAGETVRFTVDYTLLGAVRHGDDAQSINLDALPDYDTRVERATLRIVPPPGVTADAISVESGADMSAAQIQPDGALLFTNQELPATRARWELVITLPPNATSGPIPQWQQTFEAAVAEQAARAAAEAQRTLGLRTGGILATVAAVAGGFWLWWTRGRRRTRALLHGYVAEPPSDLAPGIVAYLLDRESSERGVLASLFHLATAGVLELDLTSGVQIRRTRDEALAARRGAQSTEGALPAIASHQATLFNEVVLPHAPNDRFVALDTLAGPLRQALPRLFAEMGQDAQEYFLAGGEGRSCAPGCFGPTALFVATAIGGVILLGSGLDGTTAAILAIGGFSLVTLLIVAGLMRPMGKRRRSATGEAEAKRWTMFRTYLLHLKEYGDLGAAQEILDRHFAYAVALGAESVVLAQAEEMGAALPPWMPVPTHFPVDLPSTSGPTGDGWPRPDLSPRPVTPGGIGSAPVPGGATVSMPATPRPRPSLSGLSGGMGESLSRSSRSFGALLSTAAGAGAATVVVKSRLRDRPMEWSAGTPPSKMLDDVMRHSLRDAQSLREKPPVSTAAPGWGGHGLGGSGRGGGSTWGGGSWGGGSSSRGSSSGWSRGSSRSSGGFSSSRSSGSRSSSSRSSSSRSSSSRSGGRSGFGKR